jgi:predicted dehydrogenase
MSEKKCRWGILSAAGIARKNWHSIALSGNGETAAVASRSRDKAQQFINDCQMSVPVSQNVDALGNYDELLARDDIDAIYIPLPTGLRTEWVIKAANAGKHVMVEKPCGATTDELKAIIEACNTNNVQFMDGVMFMHSTRLPAMRQVLNDAERMGQLRRITSEFTFRADDQFFKSNIRGSMGLEPAGCLGDLGWYTIRFTLWAMNYEMPVEVRGRILAGVDRTDGMDKVPTEFEGNMLFANGTSAAFFNSFHCENSQTAVINGENGYLQVEDFVLPFFGNELTFAANNHAFDVDTCRFNMQRRTQRIGVQEYSNNAANAQEVNMFRKFASLVHSGEIDQHWPEIALKTQQVMDASLESARNDGNPVKL